MRIYRNLASISLSSMLLAMAFFFVLPVHAATISSITAEDRGDFVMGPGKVEVVGDPGETVIRYITITNRINQTVSFNVEVEDFIGTRDAITPVVLLGSDKSPYSFRDFVKPETNEFTLKFGERITLPVEIAIPADAQPGGYYTSVLVSNAPSLEEASSTQSTSGKTKIVSRIGSLFFIRVKGPVEEAGYLQDFKIQGQKRVIYPKAPDGFEILFENTGTIHVVPYGLVTIRNMLGKTVAQMPVDAYFALPQSLRYREINWTEPGFLLGRYTATLELNRGYGDIVDTQKIAFWVIPFKILITIVLVILVLSLIIYYIMTRFEFRRKV